MHLLLRRMQLLRKSEPRKKRQTQAGASGRRICCGVISSLPASSFRMMRVSPASGFEDNLSPNFVWRASVGGRTEDRIAARRCGAAPKMTRTRPLAEDRLVAIGDRLR